MKRLHFVVFCMAMALLVCLSTVPVTSARAAEPFARLDVNGDGKLTRSEYLNACPREKAQCEEEFSWYDRNRDGVVTPEEFDGRVK